MSSVNLLSSFRSPANGVAYQAVDLENEDNSERCAYTIRRKPVPALTLHSVASPNSSVAPEKPAATGIAARALKRDYLELISSIIVLALPLPFFALAVYSAYIHGKSVKQDQWQSIQAYMKISVTAFPIVFAATAGRTLKKTSSWRLENGARVGVLEQLNGSTSLGGTIMSIFSLRLYDTLAPILLLVWLLSPLGGQSSLHLVTVGTYLEISTINVTYFDTRSESIFAGFGSEYDVYIPTTNAVFQTSIMEPSSATSSQRDLWGNVKIPDLSSIASSDALMSPNWTNIAFGQNLSYSSLLGIPLSGLPGNGRTNMTLETCYFTLTQVEQPSNITSGIIDGSYDTTGDLNNGTWHWAVDQGSFEDGLIMALDGFNAKDRKFGLGYGVYDEDSGFSVNTEFVHHAARYIAVSSDTFNYIRFYMLSVTYVETAVSCEELPLLCQPTAIRASQQPHINSNLTNLAYSDTWMNFGVEMISAVLLMQSGVPTITEAFVNNPSNAAEATISFNYGGYYNLTATDQQLQTRTQQLINTYWQASVNPAIAIVGLKDATNLDKMQNIRTRSVEATNTLSIDIYRVNWAWWVAFMCATSILFALACLALMIDCFLRGPEILGYCTTFLRDSPFATNGRGVGSAMRASERTRRWKNVEIKLVDVQAGEDMGYIAVVEVEKAALYGEKLEKGGRLYI